MLLSPSASLLAPAAPLCYAKRGCLGRVPGTRGCGALSFTGHLGPLLSLSATSRRPHTDGPCSPGSGSPFSALELGYTAAVGVLTLRGSRCLAPSPVVDVWLEACLKPHRRGRVHTRLVRWPRGARPAAVSACLTRAPASPPSSLELSTPQQPLHARSMGRWQTVQAGFSWLAES